MQRLGGQPGAIFRYGGTPLAGQVPAEWSDKIMHGSLTLGGQVVMGADVAPDHYEAAGASGVLTERGSFAGVNG